MLLLLRFMFGKACASICGGDALLLLEFGLLMAVETVFDDEIEGREVEMTADAPCA